MKVKNVLYFSAVWCGPCKVVWPWVQKISAAHGHTVRKVDIDSEPAPSWLMGVPTVIVEFDDGQQAVLNPSVLSRESFTNTLKMGE